MRRASAAALGLCLVGLGGCRGGDREIERRIDDAAATEFGSARVYRSYVSAGLLAEMTGHVQSVTTDGLDVQAQSGLLLDRVHVDLKGVTVDRRHWKLRSIRSASFKVRFGKNSLEEYLAGEQPDVRQFTIEPSEGRLVYSGTWVRDGRASPFRIVATLTIEHGGLAVHVDRSQMRETPPDALAQFFVDRMRRAAALGPISTWARFEHVNVASNAITLEGSIDKAALIAAVNERAK